jgi:peptidoglycan LD-endopeptidase LytH
MQDNFVTTAEHDDCGAHADMRTKPYLKKKLHGMLFMLLSLLLALTTGSGRAATTSDTPPAAESAPPPLSTSCKEFDRLNTLIRDGRIPREQARREVPRLLGLIKEEFFRDGGKSTLRSDWLFPLRGHTKTAVGEGPSHGYLPKGYDYYNGNRHGGHPSLDIFIHDRNQDDLDDRTGEPVAVLSVAGGVVVSRETEWQEGSNLRGGKYLWIYDPSTEHLFYYAHLREVVVPVGKRVMPGEILGFVGRSGLNAHKRRSPTHLHLTCLSTATVALLPENIYPDLVRARTVK